MFRVNQKVVCIRNINPADVRYGESIPVKGAVYTVRDITIDLSDNQPGVRLEEIINPPHRYLDGTRECCFDQVGFRPIVSRKTDISSLEALLLPNAKVLEGV